MLADQTQALYSTIEALQADASPSILLLQPDISHAQMHVLSRMAAVQVSSKQLRDDLMTMLIAGHETTAAVLTWTLHCLAQNPEYVPRLQAEVHQPFGPELLAPACLAQ